MERGRVWPVGLESIQEDCLFNDLSSDISDDEARIEVIRQGLVSFDPSAFFCHFVFFFFKFVSLSYCHFCDLVFYHFVFLQFCLFVIFVICLLKSFCLFTQEIEQAEFDRLEATLDKSFARPTLEKEEVEKVEEKEERMDDIFFAESRQEQIKESVAEFFEHTTQLNGNSMNDGQIERENEGFSKTRNPNVPASPTKRATAPKSKTKKSFTLEEGRQEIEKRLMEMRRTEIDQVISGSQL